MGASSCNSRRPADDVPGRRTRTERGFTLVEVMVCTLILTTGMLGIAGLLAVTTGMHIGAREAARSTRLADEKIDELMKLNFASDASVQVGGSLTANVANYFEVPDDENGNPLTGVTVRWTVAAHTNPALTDLRILTVRVENYRAQQYREVDMSTIIRQW